jgi:hypothetical protein
MLRENALVPDTSWNPGEAVSSDLIFGRRFTRPAVMPIQQDSIGESVW